MASTSGGTAKGSVCSPSVFSCLVGALLLHARVLLYRLGRYSGCGLGAVAYLRVGGGGADGAPCLA